MSNELIKLLNAFPIEKYPWSVADLSSNPNITLEYVLAHPNERWDWDNLSVNPGITLKNIDDHPELNWNIGGLSKNPNITIEYVKNNLDKDWHWRVLSQNPGIKLEDIESNLDLQWVWASLAFNPNITTEFILKYVDNSGHFLEIFSFCYTNPKISLEDIMNNRILHNDSYRLSKNPNLTLQYVLNKKIEWNWYDIGQCPNINFYDIFDNPDYEKLVVPYKKAFMNGMSLNPNTNIRTIIDNPDYDWDWFNVWANPSITLQDFDKYSSLLTPSYYALSANPNLTTDYVIKHYDKFAPLNWVQMSKNLFGCHDFFKNEIVIRI